MAHHQRDQRPRDPERNRRRRRHHRRPRQRHRPDGRRQRPLYLEPRRRQRSGGRPGGFDTLEFHGANVNEKFVLSADGSHALLTRDVANITTDTLNLERVELTTLGGADQITVNDLTHTAVREVAIDLGAADGAADAVTVNVTDANDKIAVTLAGGLISIVSAHEKTTIANAHEKTTIATPRRPMP